MVSIYVLKTNAFSKNFTVKKWRFFIFWILPSISRITPGPTYKLQIKKILFFPETVVYLFVQS